jgi:hypothetical protein
MKTQKITQEEYDKLMELSKRAHSAPVITFDSGKTSMASRAREDVMLYWKQLGKKYNFQWDTVIDSDPKTLELKFR